jgi:hypothetical protein
MYKQKPHSNVTSDERRRKAIFENIKIAFEIPGLRRTSAGAENSIYLRTWKTPTRIKILKSLAFNIYLSQS